MNRFYPVYFNRKTGQHQLGTAVKDVSNKPAELDVDFVFTGFIELGFTNDHQLTMSQVL